MRVDSYASRNEKRDAIDQRWFSLLAACDLSPLLLPNHLSSVTSILNQNNIHGVILTGGNTPSTIGGDAFERDRVETALIEWALATHHPLLGVCRGMQMIQLFFGSTLEEIEGHVAQNHMIEGVLGKRKVNSFHGYGCKDQKNPYLSTIAYAEDGVIEAVAHKTKNIKGIMWHPERMDSFDVEDISLIKGLFYA